MADMTRAVLVGCGGISKVWLDALARRSDVEVVGLVDVDPDAARRRAEEYRLTNAVVGEDVRRVVREVAPSIIFDCTPPDQRPAIAAEALAAGCHLLMEKPLAATRQDAYAVVKAASRSGRMWAVMQNRRYLPQVRAIRRLVSSGALGRLTLVTSDFFLGAHFEGFRLTMPHVLLADMAIHTFDMARYMSGTDPIDVSCVEWNPAGSWFSSGAAAIATFRMTGGIVYSYRGCWCSEGCATTWEGQWRFVCERGSIVWDGADRIACQRVSGGTGLLRETEDVEVAVPVLPATGHAGCISDFLECIATGRKPETSMDDNIKSVEMVFSAIEASTKEGTPASMVTPQAD